MQNIIVKYNPDMTAFIMRIICPSSGVGNIIIATSSEYVNDQVNKL